MKVANDPAKDFGLGNIQYPLRFWKVVCVVDGTGEGRRLRAHGFILDQQSVVDRFGIERFDAGRFRRYQRSLTDIAAAARLVFDPALLAADTMPA